MQITYNEMKYIFRNHEEILSHNQKRILELYSEMEKEDNMEQFISLKSIQFSDSIRTYGTKSDLSDVLEKIHRIQREKTLEVRSEFNSIMTENQRINRLLICYRSFATVDINAHDIIRKIYVEGMTYEAVEMGTRLSHRSFEKKRKYAMNTIKQLFESDYTNSQILKKVDLHIK